MRRRDFLKLAGAGAAGVLLPALGCPERGTDGPRLDAGAQTPDATQAGADAASVAGPDAGAAPGKKTLHYFTDFASPEAQVRAGAGTVAAAFSPESAGLARGQFGMAGQVAKFFMRNGATSNEDHPPGGGDYRMAADLDEAWLFKGTVFDVDPRTLTIDLIDAHTHPLVRDTSGNFGFDSGPLVANERSQGVGMALTMAPGAFAVQRANVLPLCQANRWLVPLVWIEPQTDSAADVESMVRDHGFKGLKFHPTISAYDADGPAMDGFLEVARSLGVPVQIHSATDDHATPERVAALAGRFPDVRIVMVHTELGAIDKHHALSTIAALPNVFAETSWTNPDGVLLAMQMLDSSRTLFGTDATVDGWQHFTNKSIADPSGQYTLTIPDVIAQVRARANADAYANWARLTAIRLYDLRFKG